MSFEIKSDTYNVEYEYTISPAVKNSANQLKLEIKGYVTYEHIISKAFNKILGCLFDRRQKQSLEKLKSLLLVTFFRLEYLLGKAQPDVEIVKKPKFTQYESALQ